MKIILVESVSTLGSVGDVVNVRPGYARNYLFPQKKAVVADAKSMKQQAHQAMILEHKMKRAREKSAQMEGAISGKTIVVRRKSADKEKLFGSVTTMDIEKLLKEEGVVVSRKAIHLEEPIKKVGTYTVPLRLDGGVESKVTIEVAAEED